MELWSKQSYADQNLGILFQNCFQVLSIGLQIVARHLSYDHTAQCKFRINNPVRIHCVDSCKLWIIRGSSCPAHACRYEENILLASPFFLLQVLLIAPVDVNKGLILLRLQVVKTLV